jgi:hypothetical protein
MRSKLVVGFVMLTVTCAGFLGLWGGSRAVADDPCVRRGAPPVGVTVDGGALTDGHGGVPAVQDRSSGYQLRGVSSNGRSVAYVRDRSGGDEVVVAQPGGQQVVVRQAGDVSRPAWGRGGALAWGVDDRLVLRSAGGTLRRVPGPRPGGQVIATAFDPRGVVAVVGAAPTAAVPEGEWSDDLWRYANGRWTRLTRFPAGADRWTAIRTPFTAPDGSVSFVVVRGRASSTALPRFALWRLHGNRARVVRSLPSETYLAGFAPGGGYLWNVPDRANARWLLRDDAGAIVGCGAVAVDPMDTVDPDRTGHAAPPPAPHRGAIEVGDPAEVALLVGDFANETAAAVVAERLTRAYAGSVPIDVVDGSGPGVPTVQPGRWAVLVRLGANTDGSAELQHLRELAPDLASHTWIVVP